MKGNFLETVICDTQIPFISPSVHLVVLYHICEMSLYEPMNNPSPQSWPRTAKGLLNITSICASLPLISSTCSPAHFCPFHFLPANHPKYLGEEEMRGERGVSVLRSHVLLRTVLTIVVGACSGLVQCELLNKTDVEQETIAAECHAASADPNYYDHPDMFIRAPDIIKKYGYPVEVHHVTTEDGYILEVHRIPYGKKSPPGTGPKLPVFLQHGIMANSVNWLLPPVEKSLAYRLADLGYDVWVGNVRGCSYSLGHINPKKQSTGLAYWDFSWHEMGIYDVPAVIDYILEETGHKNLTYIGHSMGCTMFFVCMSLRPEYNHKINMMFGLAPVAFTGNSTSFFKLLAPLSFNLERFYYFVGGGQLIPAVLQKILNPVITGACRSSTYVNCNICTSLYFLLFNSDGRQLNHTMLPVITSHFPDIVSTKTVSHYGQNIITGNFEQFDTRLVIPPFSPGGQKPKKYDLSKVTAPTALFYADRDNLADTRDVLRLSKLLPNLKALVRVCYPFFNHNDFLFGIHVNELVYDKLISILHHGNYRVDLNCERAYVDQVKDNVPTNSSHV